MTRAFVFPGQGSQSVGMGKSLADAFEPARRLFEEIDEAIGQPLSNLMFEGPEETLTLTENAQPALMAVSMAVMCILQDEAGLEVASAASHVAGHSLGEYSALAAAGSLTVTTTARLLQTRGRAMQQAVQVGAGAMAAIIGSDLETVETIATEAAQGDICTVANDNAPVQIVLSGDSAAIDRAIEIAKLKGAKRSIKLAVSAPFHCALMEPAARAMEAALAATELTAPSVPLVANVTAAPVTSPAEIKSLLVEQVTARVRWRESVTAMAGAGVTQLVEIGVGKVLSGLTRRIDRSLDAVNIATADDIKDFLATL